MRLVSFKLFQLQFYVIVTWIKRQLIISKDTNNNQNVSTIIIIIIIQININFKEIRLTIICFNNGIFNDFLYE